MYLEMKKSNPIKLLKSDDKHTVIEINLNYGKSITHIRLTESLIKN